MLGVEERTSSDWGETREEVANWRDLKVGDLKRGRRVLLTKLPLAMEVAGVGGQGSAIASIHFWDYKSETWLFLGTV